MHDAEPGATASDSPASGASASAAPEPRVSEPRAPGSRASQPEPQQGRSVDRHFLWILGRDEDGDARILSQLEYEPKFAHGRFESADFSCPACNYKLSAPRSEWVLVPQPARIHGGLETVSYFALHRDLSIQVAVHTDARDPESAVDLLRAIVDSPARRLPFEERSAIEPWMPAAKDELPEDFGGARVRLVHAGGARTSWLYVLVYGDVHYMIELEGATDVVESDVADAHAIIDSFCLIDPSLDAEALSKQARMKLAKGRLEDGTFTHDPTGVRFEIPMGWRAEPFGSSHLFELRCYAPDSGSRVTIHGVEVRTRASADRLIDATIEAQNTVAGFEDSGWSAVPPDLPGCGGLTAAERASMRVRTFRGVCTMGAFCLHWILHPEVGSSVVLEARGVDSTECAAAERALEAGLSLRR